MEILVIIIGGFVVLVAYGIYSGIETNKKVKEDNAKLTVWLSENGYDIDPKLKYEAPLSRAHFMVELEKEELLISRFESNSEIEWKPPVVVKFSDIIGCELKEDSNVVGGISRALIGGAIAGNTGAIIGATTAKKERVYTMNITIFTNNIKEPDIVVPLLPCSCKRDETTYRQAVNCADKIIATIKAIVSQQTSDRAK